MQDRLMVAGAACGRCRKESSPSFCSQTRSLGAEAWTAFARGHAPKAPSLAPGLVGLHGHVYELPRLILHLGGQEEAGAGNDEAIVALQALGRVVAVHEELRRRLAVAQLQPLGWSHTPPRALSAASHTLLVQALLWH